MEGAKSLFSWVHPFLSMAMGLRQDPKMMPKCEANAKPCQTVSNSCQNPSTIMPASSQNYVHEASCVFRRRLQLGWTSSARNKEKQTK